MGSFQAAVNEQRGSQHCVSQRIDPGTAAVGFFRISISGIDLYHKPSTWKIIDLAGGTARCCVQNPFF